MTIEIVDFPSYKMVIFHSYVNVYQRVNCFFLIFLGFTTFTMIKHTIFLKTIHQYVHSIVLLATSYTIESHHVDLHFWIDQTPAYFFRIVYSSPTWDLHIFFCVSVQRWWSIIPWNAWDFCELFTENLWWGGSNTQSHFQIILNAVSFSGYPHCWY